MLHLARLAIRKPKATLFAWVIFAVVLSAIGLGVKSSLSPSVVVVPGTESSRAQTLADQEFGPSILVPILLQGPASQIDAQGPKLVQDLSKRPDTRVMSAWSSGSAGPALRPKPNAAMIIASVARSEKAMVKTYQAQIERVVKRDITSPVRASVSGQPSVDQAVKTAALNDALRAELIAIPILFVLLLLMLRSPLAAGIISIFGGVTVLTGFGEMATLGKFFAVDPIAVALASMAGLALGVGFALVIVRRFREEETADGSRAAAARAATATVASSGRAILFGATALIITMVIALLLSSMAVQFSLGVGVVACAALGVGAAVAVMPAVLVLMGHRMDVWHPKSLGPIDKAWNGLVGVGDRIVRRPVVIGALATAMLGALAIPVLSLKTGPPDITQLPASNQARQNFEAISNVMGPGWATPYSVLLVSTKHPITATQTLKSISVFQKQIAANPQVDTVLGPGEFNAQRKDLKKLPAGLDQSAAVAKSSKKDLLKLKAGLGQAGAGAAQLRSGLSAAAGGAGQLKGGSGTAQAGAGTLKNGIGTARAGSRKISAGLATALAGATALRDGAAQALAGSKQLQGGLGQANTPLQAGLPAVGGMSKNSATASSAISTGKGQAGTASADISGALSKLQSMGTDAKKDPNYGAAVSALSSAKAAADQVTSTLSNAAGPASQAAAVASVFADQTAQLASGVKQLLAGSTELSAGIAKLESGNGELASGISKLNTGGGSLTSGLGQLEAGAGQLESGLGQLTSGSGQLQSGLSSGVGPSGELVTGLGTMEAAVAKARSQIPSTKDLETLKKQSPGLFNSGYFVLAAIEGAPAADAETASFAVNLQRGGNAGMVVVVPKQAATTQATQDLGRTLAKDTKAFAATQAGMKWGVGGPAGNLTDYRSFGDAHMWLVIAAIVAAISILLMVAVRALVLPLVAVALDVLTALASFGVLTLLFTGSDPVLGGPGYLDPMSVIGIFAVVFGITTMYEMLLLVRTRELFVETGDARESLRRALRSTAAAATGAGIVMAAVVTPFLFADLTGVRQFGLGVVTVVLIDTLIVRPLLLPAAVSVFGRRAWWPTKGPEHPLEPRPEPEGGTPIPEQPIDEREIEPALV